MHGDPGYARYFAEIALFIFSMTGLVLALNLVWVYYRVPEYHASHSE